MKLTITDIERLHGRCNDPDCPVCRWWTPKGGATPKTMAWNKKRVTAWLKERVSLLPCTAKSDSPWWLVEEEKENCRDLLRNPPTGKSPIGGVA